MKLERVFIALPVDRTLCAKLADLIAPYLNRNIRPVAQQNFHLTVAFLGAVTRTQLHELKTRMDILGPQVPDRIEIGGIRRFPGKTGHVVAATICNSEELKVLYQSTLNLLESSSITINPPKLFRPHITLARVRRRTAHVVEIPLEKPIVFNPVALGIYEGIHTETTYRYQCLFSTDRRAGSSAG